MKTILSLALLLATSCAGLQSPVEYGEAVAYCGNIPCTKRVVIPESEFEAVCEEERFFEGTTLKAYTRSDWSEVTWASDVRFFPTGTGGRGQEGAALECTTEGWGRVFAALAKNPQYGQLYQISISEYGPLFPPHTFHVNLTVVCTPGSKLGKVIKAERRGQTEEEILEWIHRQIRCVCDYPLPQRMVL